MPDMNDGQILISVWMGKATVSRWIRRNGTYTIEDAANSHELEIRAQKEARARTDGKLRAGLYDASDELAQQARWE